MKRYQPTEDVREDYVAPRPGKALQVRLKSYFTTVFLPLCRRHDVGADVCQELRAAWKEVDELLTEYCVPPPADRHLVPLPAPRKEW